MSNNSTGGGMGLAGGLLIAFIVLKLTHTINWSWIWVLSPIWLPIALWLFFGIVMVLIVWAVKD